MISIKVIKKGSELLIAACDEELLGKKFIQKNRQIDVSKFFYDGDRISEEQLEQYLQEATIANLVGTKTVTCALELKLIDPDCVLKIKGVPHAQIVHMI
jgi:uncharacterized protein